MWERQGPNARGERGSREIETRGEGKERRWRQRQLGGIEGEGDTRKRKDWFF